MTLPPKPRRGQRKAAAAPVEPAPHKAWLARLTDGRALKRKLAKLATTARNAPVAMLAVLGTLALETLSTGTIMHINRGVIELPFGTARLAYVEAAFSFVCALLASATAAAAVQLGTDPRSEQRQRAKNARTLSWALLIVPVFYLAQHFTFTAQMADFQSWHGSAAETAAIANAAADPANTDLAFDLRRSMEPRQVDMGSFRFFAFLAGAGLAYALLTRTAATAWLPKPETEAEARRRERTERAKRAARTRELNRIAKADAAKAAVKAHGLASILPAFIRGVFDGGRDYPAFEAPDAGRKTG